MLQVVPFWPMTLSLFAALYRGVGNEWITVSTPLPIKTLLRLLTPDAPSCTGWRS